MNFIEYFIHFKNYEILWNVHLQSVLRNAITVTLCPFFPPKTKVGVGSTSWTWKPIHLKKKNICLIVSQIYSDHFSYTFFTDGLFHVSFGVTTSCHQKNSTRLKKFVGIFQVSFTKLLHFCFGVDRTFGSRVGIIQPFVQNQSIFFV